MSRIYGVLCDGCGISDIVSAEGFYEDTVPRNKWISLNVYDENGDVEGKELHACTGACLEMVSKKLRGLDTNIIPTHNHDHDHDHDHNHD